MLCKEANTFFSWSEERQKWFHGQVKRPKITFSCSGKERNNPLCIKAYLSSFAQEHDQCTIWHEMPLFSLQILTVDLEAMLVERASWFWSLVATHHQRATVSCSILRMRRMRLQRPYLFTKARHNRKIIGMINTFSNKTGHPRHPSIAGEMSTITTIENGLEDVAEDGAPSIISEKCKHDVG